MVHNSTNINKTNNYLSPQLTEQKNNKKRHRNMTLEIHALVWDRHKHIARLNRMIGFQPFPLDDCISNGNAYMYINKR